MFEKARILLYWARFSGLRLLTLRWQPHKRRLQGKWQCLLLVTTCPQRTFLHCVRMMLYIIWWVMHYYWLLRKGRGGKTQTYRSMCVRVIRRHVQQYVCVHIVFSRISWWSARANFFRPSAARHTHFLRGATLHPPLTVERVTKMTLKDARRLTYVRNTKDNATRHRSETSTFKAHRCSPVLDIVWISSHLLGSRRRTGGCAADSLGLLLTAEEGHVGLS